VIVAAPHCASWSVSQHPAASVLDVRPDRRRDTTGTLAPDDVGMLLLQCQSLPTRQK